MTWHGPLVLTVYPFVRCVCVPCYLSVDICSSLFTCLVLLHSHCRQLFLSMHRLDRGLLSEPLMSVQAYVEYQHLSSDRDRFAWYDPRIAVPRDLYRSTLL
jgi:hypothetical protein